MTCGRDGTRDRSASDIFTFSDRRDPSDPRAVGVVSLRYYLVKALRRFADCDEVPWTRGTVKLGVTSGYPVREISGGNMSTPLTPCPSNFIKDSPSGLPPPSTHPFTPSGPQGTSGVPGGAVVLIPKGLLWC